MRDAVKRANSIIGDLLKLSAATDFERKPEELHPVIERSLRLLRNDLVNFHITLALQFAPDLPIVPIDQSRLEQVFINLFLNSIQAMPQGGTLRVATRALDVDDEQCREEPLLRHFRSASGVVLVEVQDTGSGIPDHVLPRVFDPFFTTKPVGVGTGLGLSIAKKIVDLHGGAIQIKNVPPCGVRVTIALAT
jgi:signal transduction histidine kinase